MKGICLVGCGRIGRMHARNLRGRAALYFCSRSRPSAEKLQEEFRGRAVFADIDQALDAGAVDAVVIASPPQYHQEQIVAALQAGKSVLVEKPVCVASEQLDAIESALGSHPDQFLMVAENYYYTPSLTLTQRLIEQGHVGRVRSVVLRKLFAQPEQGWRTEWGALLEGGIHFIALMSGILDAAPQRVTAEFPGLRPGQKERHSITRLEYADGAVGELSYAWNVPSRTRGTFQHSHIAGTEGRILFESNGIYLWLRGARQKRFCLPGFRDMMGYGSMTQDFLGCLEDAGRRPYSDFHKAKRDLQIVFAAYRDLQTDER